MALSQSRARSGRRRLAGLVTSAALLAGMVTAGTLATGAGAAAPAAPSGWKSVWIEDFNGPAGSLPDPTKWNIETGGHGNGNAELQNYTNRPSNVSLDGAGNLVITARKENYGNCWYGACTHTSGRLQTMNKFSQKYGRIEARVKVPTGRGLWPAFWMLGDNLGTVGWPNSGEIDIMEILGHEPNKTYGTLHGPGYSGGGSIGRSYTKPSGSFADGFHTFGVDWAPDSMKWYVDGVHYSTLTPSDLRGNKWVFDHPEFVLLNLAVGGNWPGSPDAATQFPAQYIIDYVATYQADTAPPLPPAPPAGNIAVGKPTTSSSNEGASTSAGAATDGNTGTRWSSGFSDQQHIQVDLGSTHNISGVNLNWEAAYGRGYQIQTSNDGNTWTNIYSTTTGDGGVDNLTVNGTGRYVRMQGTQRATPYGYSLWEFGIQGAPTNLGDNLLSQGRPTTASSMESGGTAAGNATDGNPGTRWSSAFSDAQSLTVDLGSSRPIGKVVLNWEAAYARAFKIQTSNDGNAWVEVYSTTSGAGGVQTINVAGSGRYVRMSATQRATPWGYSLWEMQVFGP